MKTIHRSEIPNEYTYYRTGSQVFYEYYKNISSLVVHRIGKWYEFLKAMQFFPGLWSVSIEKHDEEVQVESLKKLWIHHGVIFWTPIRIMQMPIGWIQMPKWFVKWQNHSSRSAFSVLDQEDYWNKWSPSARAHRRHVEDHIKNGKIRVEDSDIKTFLHHYTTVKIHDPNKRFVARFTQKLFSDSKSSYRVYIAYVDDVALAGAVFIDEGVTSEYWASFYTKESYPYHLGIALMDRWLLDSYKKWIKYCDLDHMRDAWQSFWYSGYTKFKEWIADYDAHFHDMWIKIF